MFCLSEEKVKEFYFKVVAGFGNECCNDRFINLANKNCVLQNGNVQSISLEIVSRYICGNV